MAWSGLFCPFGQNVSTKESRFYLDRHLKITYNSFLKKSILIITILDLAREDSTPFQYGEDLWKDINKS